MMRVVKKGPPAGLVLFIGLLVALLAVTCFYLGWQERELRAHQRTAMGRALEFRDAYSNHRHSYQVRYQFQTAPRGPYYSYRDPIWGENAYAPMKYTAWVDAQAQPHLAVVYDARDPWNNHPAGGADSGPAFWFAAGAFCLIGFCVLAVLVATGRTRDRVLVVTA